MGWRNSDSYSRRQSYWIEMYAARITTVILNFSSWNSIESNNSLLPSYSRVPFMHSLVNELSALRTKRLMANFDTDDAQQDREIDMKTREITELFHHAEGLLQVFDKQRKDPNISQSEAAVITNMLRSQTKKLQGLKMSFKSTQKVCLIMFVPDRAMSTSTIILCN